MFFIKLARIEIILYFLALKLRYYIVFRLYAVYKSMWFNFQSK